MRITVVKIRNTFALASSEMRMTQVCDHPHAGMRQIKRQRGIINLNYPNITQ
jgi:hypothetical protein